VIGPLAYLDPGSGSLILQVVLGLIAAGWVFLRAKWDAVKAWFRPAEETPSEQPAADASSTEPANADSAEAEPTDAEAAVSEPGLAPDRRRSGREA
jgi:cytoskeletal protein RodZ